MFLFIMLINEDVVVLFVLLFVVYDIWFVFCICILFIISELEWVLIKNCLDVFIIWLFRNYDILGFGNLWIGYMRWMISFLIICKFWLILMIVFLIFLRLIICFVDVFICGFLFVMIKKKRNKIWMIGVVWNINFIKLYF